MLASRYACILWLIYLDFTVAFPSKSDVNEIGKSAIAKTVSVADTSTKEKHSSVLDHETSTEYFNIERSNIFKDDANADYLMERARKDEVKGNQVNLKSGLIDNYNHMDSESVNNYLSEQASDMSIPTDGSKNDLTKEKPLVGTKGGTLDESNRYLYQSTSKDENVVRTLSDNTYNFSTSQQNVNGESNTASKHSSPLTPTDSFIVKNENGMSTEKPEVPEKNMQMSNPPSSSPSNESHSIMKTELLRDMFYQMGIYLQSSTPGYSLSEEKYEQLMMDILSRMDIYPQPSTPVEPATAEKTKFVKSVLQRFGINLPSSTPGESLSAGQTENANVNRVFKPDATNLENIRKLVKYVLHNRIMSNSVYDSQNLNDLEIQRTIDYLTKFSNSESPEKGTTTFDTMDTSGKEKGIESGSTGSDRSTFNMNIFGKEKGEVSTAKGGSELNIKGSFGKGIKDEMSPEKPKTETTAEEKPDGQQENDETYDTSEFETYEYDKRA